MFPRARLLMQVPQCPDGRLDTDTAQNITITRQRTGTFIDANSGTGAEVSFPLSEVRAGKLEVTPALPGHGSSY